MTKIQFKAYTIIERAVSEGVAYGIRRAHKHVEKPTNEILEEKILDAVMLALSEIIDFDTTEINPE